MHMSNGSGVKVRRVWSTRDGPVRALYLGQTWARIQYQCRYTSSLPQVLDPGSSMQGDRGKPTDCFIWPKKI